MSSVLAIEANLWIYDLFCWYINIYMWNLTVGFCVQIQWCLMHEALKWNHIYFCIDTRKSKIELLWVFSLGGISIGWLKKWIRSFVLNHVVNRIFEWCFVCCFLYIVMTKCQFHQHKLKFMDLLIFWSCGSHEATSWNMSATKTIKSQVISIVDTSMSFFFYWNFGTFSIQFMFRLKKENSDILKML